MMSTLMLETCRDLE